MFCPRCGGILLSGIPPSGTAVIKLDGIRYHVHCGYKELEFRADEMVKQRLEGAKVPTVPKKEV